MRAKLLINDLHLGVQRVAGTTPQTVAQLRSDLYQNLRSLLVHHLDKDLYINGDALDAFDVDRYAGLQLYNLCVEFLESSVGDVVLARGNHDASKDSSRLSMFDFICSVLKAQYGDRVIVVTEPTSVAPGHYFIPHLANQELFNLALDEALEVDAPCYIYLHANYDNGFAAESDHSLNVSAEQAKKLTDKGLHLIFGHEHQAKDLPGITIVGNQFPTSIADCLGNDRKRALVIDSRLGRTEVTTWQAEGSFIEVPWDEMDTIPETAQFIRVTGQVKSEQAADVLAAIAKLRQRSLAYVVTNAVKFEGQGDMDELEVSAQEMKAFDVTNFLYEQLDERQAATVKRLLAERAEDAQ